MITTRICFGRLQKVSRDNFCPLSRRDQNRAANELIRRTRAEEIRVDLRSLPAHSKFRCETRTGRDKELIWTEKFIVPAGVPRRDVAHMIAITQTARTTTALSRA